MKREIVCGHCGKPFQSMGEYRNHEWNEHPITAVAGDTTVGPNKYNIGRGGANLWTRQQAEDLLNRHNPFYPANMLKRIEALEQRIAALEAENERLKAGK